MTFTPLKSARALLRAAMLMMPVATLAVGAVGTGLASVATAVLTATPAAAKTPGARYCFARACHRVMTLAETHAAVGKPVSAVTSFYDDCRRDRYNPCGLTSSGEAFRPGESNSAASPIYPDGTVVLVRNPSNGESAIVRINNAGPYWGNRTLDLSRAAGVKLGLAGVGVARVEVTVLRAPNSGEATYRRGRVYAPLPGHVGSFASMDDARIYAAMTMDLPDSALPAAHTIIAHADTTAEPVSPVSYVPITGKSRARRLPADVVRVSAADTVPAESGVTSQNPRTAALAAEVPSIAVQAIEIGGAALLVPAAGETTRVVSERASIIGALRAGDFDRRGKSLLVPVGGDEAGDDEAAADAQASHTRGPARLVAVSAADAAARGVETLRLERMPPLATRGERGWYRRSVASVSHVIDFAPGTVATQETRLAHWAALRASSFAKSIAQSGDARSSTAALGAGAGNGVHIVQAAVGRDAAPIDDDRMRRITRAPARARNEFDLTAV